jgi:hypothetical protein
MKRWQSRESQISHIHGGQSEDEGSLLESKTKEEEEERERERTRKELSTKGVR